MTDKEKLHDETASEENLKGIGQEILGDLEIIGGMLTGNPGAIAEGKFSKTNRGGQSHRRTLGPKVL